MQHTFYTPDSLMTSPVRVLLVGAGGTGSEMLDALARIHHALLGVGHPHGLVVCLADGDEVSATNIGRARFSIHDVGMNKAALLVHRYNIYYGLNWVAIPHALTAKEIMQSQFDLLVTCVDRAALRVEIGKLGRKKNRSSLWLDCGNGTHDGQVVLGHFHNEHEFSLPNVYDLFSELENVLDDAEPSCSMQDALRNQDLFVNRWIADCAGALLWKLLRQGKIETHGGFVNVQSGTVNPLAINEDVWRFYGYQKPFVTAVKKGRRLSVVEDIRE